jgi:hypothetical protein
MTKNVIKIIAIGLFAYGIYAVLPDIRRYIKISTM